MATRLGAITQSVPKSLIEVAGKPFIVHQLELLRERGISEIVLCLGHFGGQVQDLLGDGQQLGVNLYYSFDGPIQLGTGGALRQALPLLGEAFLVLYGDSYLECDYSAVVEAFRESRRLGLMTVFHNDGRWDASNVQFCDSRVVAYSKAHRTQHMHHTDYGLSVFDSKVLVDYPPSTPFDLCTVCEKLLLRSELAGLEVKQRFYEIGSRVGLDETRSYLVSKQRDAR
jgi:N-acetyl-alpha-D-muramate 1-phosphate uridylyltransferase